MLKYIFQLYLKESQLALLRNNKLNIFKFFYITFYYFFISLTFIIKRFPLFIKPPLATARAAQCVGALHLFVSFFVSLSAAKMQKNAFFSKTKQFRAMVSIDDLQEVVHGHFKNPLLDP